MLSSERLNMNTIKVNRKDISSKTYTPILTYCRKLIADGTDPETILEVYREEVLSLTCHVGKCAKLTVTDDPNIRFTKYRDSFLSIGRETYDSLGQD